MRNGAVVRGMLCLATAALVLAQPLRAGAEERLGLELSPSLSMVLAAAPIRLSAAPSIQTNCALQD